MSWRPFWVSIATPQGDGLPELREEGLVWNNPGHPDAKPAKRECEIGGISVLTWWPAKGSNS